MTILECLFRFKGRMRRRDYWLKGVPFVAPLGLLLGYLIDRTILSELQYWLVAAASLLVMYPAAALGAKRLHDRGRSAWLLLVPFFGQVLSGVYQGFREGMEGFPPESYPQWLLGSLFFLAAVKVVIQIWALWIFIQIAFLRGTEGPNRYGSDPLAMQPTATGTEAA